MKSRAHDLRVGLRVARASVRRCAVRVVGKDWGDGAGASGASPYPVANSGDMNGKAAR
jgi:hypothetical protein